MFNQYTVIPINCLWVNPDNLIETIKTMNLQDDDSKWTYGRFHLDLKGIYFPAPQKGGAHGLRFAVWQPENVTLGSVLIANCVDGMIQLLRHLNRRFNIPYFHAFLASDHKKEGLCTFTYAKNIETNRVVQVIRDPKWKFYEKGEPLEFERAEYYRKKIVAERLTPEMIVQYLKYLGWDLASDRFWQSREQAWIVTER